MNQNQTCQYERFVSEGDLAALIEYVDSVYRFFGAGGDIHGQNKDALIRLKKKAGSYSERYN